jgi:hypothetical protein
MAGRVGQYTSVPMYVASLGAWRVRTSVTAASLHIFFEPVRKSIRFYSVVAPPSPPHSTNHSAQLTSSFFIYIRFWEVFCSMIRSVCIERPHNVRFKRKFFFMN